MPVLLFISPHLDDVAFSCGGTFIKAVERGYTAHLCTLFTQTVPNPRGFALQCQTDKGISPEVDYMQLRRAEDAAFARFAGGAPFTHIALPEAPHRNYNSPAELFNGARDDDDIWREVKSKLNSLIEPLKPDLIFAPQGLGNHIDHLQTIRALLELDCTDRICWYRDTPYAIRNPAAVASMLLPNNLTKIGSDIAMTLNRKIEGCCLYATQIGFQFGGAERLKEKLTAFHFNEAARSAVNGFAENFLVASDSAAVEQLSRLTC